MYNSKKSLILFDGVCNICNSSVNFILKRDTKNTFLYTSLQSDVAKKLLLQYRIKIIKNNWDSVLLIQHNKVFDKSTAVLLILKNLSFPYNLSIVFMVIPKFIRDFFYDRIAKNRYRWFGKKETCMVPTKENLNKFLD